MSPICCIWKMFEDLAWNWHFKSCFAATEFFTFFLTCEVEKCFEASTIGEHAKELEGKRAQLVDAVLGQPGDVNSC